MKLIITCIVAAVIVGFMALVTMGFIPSKTEAKVKTIVTNEVEVIKEKLPDDTKTYKKNIKHIELNQNNTLTLFDVVEPANSSALAQQITAMDDGSEDPLYLLIDSPGGSAFYGAKIISAIEASIRPVYTVCVGTCASMGAMIHSYGVKRMGTDRSVLMYHPAAGQYEGKAPNMASLMATVNRYVHKMEVNVFKRAKMSREEYLQHILVDYWIDTEDAKAAGLLDELVVLRLPQGVTLPSSNRVYLRRNAPSITDRPDFWMMYGVQ